MAIFMLQVYKYYSFSSKTDSCIFTHITYFISIFSLFTFFFINFTNLTKKLMNSFIKMVYYYYNMIKISRLENGTKQNQQKKTCKKSL